MVSKNDPNVTTMSMPKKILQSPKTTQISPRRACQKAPWPQKNNPTVTTKDIQKRTMVSKNDPNVTTMGMPKDTTVSKNDSNFITKGMPKGTMVSKKQPKSHHKRH